MLDHIQKLRVDRSAGSTRKMREQQLRVVDPPESPVEPPPVVIEEEKKRRHFEGKSVEYTIDELLQNNDHTGEISEKGWGVNQRKIPLGYAAIFLFLMGCVSVMIYQMIDADQDMIRDQGPVTDFVTEDAAARELVNSIESTVRHYLAAKSVEEKVRFVRHPEATKERMHAFYRSNPLTPQSCELIIKMRPLTLKGRPFWQLLAVIDQSRGEALLLEQISDKEVLIDWESHVDYQPMPWKQYVREPASQEMSFRVLVEESPRYVGEFMDEYRWVSYRLSNLGVEETLYGYVLRDSPLHLSLENALANGTKRMILSLQGSPEFKARQAVVIKALISEDIYRIQSPTTLTD